MSDNESRLVRCFSSVFPELTLEEIRQTTSDATGDWDSLSGVRLASVIQEEFDVEIDPMVLADLNSFEAYKTYISRIGPAVE